MDAPEISTLNLAKIANEDYVSGLNLARRKVQQATMLVRNDLMQALAASNYLPNLTATTYRTGTFVTSTTYPAENKDRGLTLHKNPKIKGDLRKLVIHKVKVYPLASKDDMSLVVQDDYAGGIETTYSIDLVANEENTFDIAYTVKGTQARVYINGTDVPVASAYLTCFTGCNGSLPNDCGYTKGYYNGVEISNKEGYGIVLEFSCQCDYDELLCRFAKGFIGEIVYLKSRVKLMEEHLRSNRFNNWVVYGREELQQYMTDVENQYREKWNAFVNAMPAALKSLRDDCIDCRGIKWVVNI